MHPDNPQLVATISIVEIFTKVVEIQVELGKINERLNDIPDHEARLRIVEQTRARLYGGCVVIGTIAGGGAGWLAVALAHR